jgi:tetratricopeptide (TPR) repeat protein
VATPTKPRFPGRAALAIVAGVIAIYASSLSHPFLLDDDVQIVENPAVTRGAPLSAYFLDAGTTSTRADYNTRIYRPLRNLGFRAVARVGGVRPIAFGVANLALYVLAVLGVLWLALALGLSPFASAWAAALWAAAPVHVESVVYASALGDQLSAVCEVAALALGVVLVRDQGSSAGRRALLGAGSVALALAAMLAKEMAVTGVALLAVALWSLGPEARTRRAALLVGAHALVTLGYLLLRTHVVGRLGQEDVTAASVSGGLRDAPVLLAGYLRLALEPLGHRATYLVPPPTASRLGIALATLLAAGALAVYGDRRSRDRPGLAVGLGWFALALLPVLHLVPLWADLADRFALVPSIGLALAAGVAISRAQAVKRGAFAGALAGALVALYAAGSVAEARVWKSDLTLWAHAADAEPGSALAHANLGASLLAAGRPADALVELERSQALGRPNAELDLRRGMALDLLGRTDEALGAVGIALQKDPSLGRAHALFGDLARRKGQLAIADAELLRARTLAPSHPSTLLLAAALAEAHGRPADAAHLYGELIARAPADPRYHHRRGVAWLAAGDPAAAAADARACLAAAPAEPACTCLYGRALSATTGGPEAAAALRACGEHP